MSLNGFRIEQGFLPSGYAFAEAGRQQSNRRTRVFIRFPSVSPPQGQVKNEYTQNSHNPRKAHPVPTQFSLFGSPPKQQWLECQRSQARGLLRLGCAPNGGAGKRRSDASYSPPSRAGSSAHQCLRQGGTWVYGESSRLGTAALKQLGITFKQTPYDVKAR